MPLRSGLPVTLSTPSLSTVYGRAPRMTDQLVVAVSQSGRFLVSRALLLAEGPAAEIAADLTGATRTVAVGRGLNLSTAHETALKTTELTGTLVVAVTGRGDDRRPADRPTPRRAARGRPGPPRRVVEGHGHHLNRIGSVVVPPTLGRTCP